MNEYVRGEWNQRAKYKPKTQGDEQESERAAERKEKPS